MSIETGSAPTKSVGRHELTPKDVDRAVRQELARIEGRRIAQRIDAERRAKQRPKLLDSIISPTQLDELPETSPLIPGVLNQNSYALLTGRDSTYKTFVALDWALCLATGLPWNDKRVTMPEDRPSVLYVAAEGAYGIRTRIRAWEQHRGMKLTEAYRKYPTGSALAKTNPEGTPTFHLKITPVNLFDGPEIEDFVNLIRLHSDIGLVILDTLRRSSGGAEQNGSDMGVVVDNISRIKEATSGGSVLALAHTDKNDNDTRGSSLIEDDADIVWHSKADKDGITLTNRKMKDGPSHSVMKLHPLNIGESLVMVTVDPFSIEAGSLGDRDIRIIEAVRVLNESGQDATAARILQTANDGHKDKISRTPGYEALAKLLKDGRLLQSRSKGPYTLPEATAGDQL